MSDSYHIPALLHESVGGLNIFSQGTYLDVTFGGGGHSREIMNHLGTKGKLLGFDQDLDAYENRIEDDRFIFVRSNFRYLKNFIQYYNIENVDGIIADLGVSFHHFDNENRGFSYKHIANLDMRMNSQAKITAAHILNEYSETKLSEIFFIYGELKSARQIASSIMTFRQHRNIESVNDFVDIIKPFTYREKENKLLAQAFQALRIEVNDELGALKEMLTQGADVLKPGGRFVVISYHSLEDRLVKNFFRTGNFEGDVVKDFYGNLQTPFKTINKKVIVPSEKEIKNNPRSRSAKLRIAEKI